MKKVILSLLSVIFLFSCSYNKKYVIAVSQCSEDIWRDKINDELIASTYFYNNIDLRFASSDNSDQTQIKQINRFVDDNVDLLIVSPNQMKTVTAAIDRAYDKGIPVILLDRKTKSDKYTAFIGADNEKIGYSIGKYVTSMLNGKGSVVEIMGLEGASPAIYRHKGFSDAIAGHPGIRLIKCMNGSWSQEGGRAIMDSLLAKGIKTDCVYGHNDRMTLGAYEAAKARGVEKSIRFIGIDALPNKDGGIKLVCDSIFEATHIYPTRGDLVMQLAMNILEGKPYKRDNYMDAALVTKDNAGVLLMQEEEMTQLNDRLDQLHGKVDMYLTQYNHQKVYLLLCVIILFLCIVSFIMIYRAIMVKRRMAEETANAKLVFFTNISHEFRTPLTLIADPVERMLEEEHLTKHQRGLLQIVKNNTNVMLRLVGEILDLRKIQNGKMTLDISRFNLTDHMKRWLACFGPLAERKNIRLRLETDDDIMISADVYKVERICYNLLSNALKYTPNGGSVTLSATLSGGNVSICVSDTGIGISKDNLSNVFDRFFRIKNNDMKGTGIGLAIVKAFAEMHHGSVDVTSEEGHGSTFTVVLPAMQKGGKTPETETVSGITSYNMAGEDISGLTEGINMEKMTSTDTSHHGYKASALVVDDNDDVRTYVASILSADYNVSTASNGKEGVEKAVREVPDIIICDVMMPVMDGIEMCSRLKAETVTSHIPVILLTARAVDSQRVEGYDCGADAYITKPFSGKVLTSRIKNLLDNRKRLKYLYGRNDMAEEKTDDTDRKFINDFRSTVQEHLSDAELNVEKIGAELGLSRVQLYRKVKALTGSSPVEIIRITRLKRAEYLLRTTDKTVSEVSYDVGFSSPSYFTKCFKDYFNILPTEVSGRENRS